MRSSPSDGGPSVALPETSRRAATPMTGSLSDSSWMANCLTITLTGSWGKIGWGVALSGGGGGASDGSGRRRNCMCPIVSWSTSSRRLKSASRLQINRTLSIFSHGPARSERTMSLIETSEESTPSTAPIETLVVGEESAREIRLANTPLSASSAQAGAQETISAAISASHASLRRRRE